MKTADLNAERSVLGSILLNDKLTYYIDLLKAQWFSDLKHRDVFEAMLAVREKEREVDPVTVVSAMIGGVSKNSDIVNSITSAYITSARIDDYLSILKDLYHVRDLKKQCQQVISEIDSSDHDAMIFVTDSAVKISDIGKGAICSRTKKASSGIVQVCDDILLQTEPKGLAKTGLGKIDEVFGGLWPEMTILGGAPGMGKSTIGLSICNHVAITSSALYISLEESVHSLQLRLLAMETGLRLNDLRRRQLPAFSNATLVAGAAAVHSKNLYIHHEPGMGIAQISAVVKRFQAERELGLLVIDHMDRVQSGGKQWEKEAVSKGLSDMIGLGGYPGLVLHQLTKEVHKRDDKRPTRGDLRYIGEADARMIWLAYRAHVYNNTMDPTLLELIVDKNNNGPCGTIPLECDLDRMYIGDWRGQYGTAPDEPAEY